VRASSLIFAAMSCGIAACSPGTGAFDATAVDVAALADGAADAALVAEFHVHQARTGTTVSGGYLSRAVDPAAIVRGHIVLVRSPVVRRDGPCIATRSPVCDPPCVGVARCDATEHCVLVEPLGYVDGGPVALRGADDSLRADLWFDRTDRAYRPTIPPGPRRLLVADERARFVGGEGNLAFDAIVTAPTPVTISVPDPASGVHVAAGADLAIRWNAGSSGVVSVTLVASANGRSVTISCEMPDAGGFAVPAAMLDILPPPPRSLRLDVERIASIVQPAVGRGLSAFVHVTESDWRTGLE